MAHGDEFTSDDITLVQQLRLGDIAALDVLVDRYFDLLRRFAYLTVRDADLAHDVVQDVIVYVWEHRTSLSLTGNLRGYLYRIARNRALDILKHERAQARLREQSPAYVITDVSLDHADDRVTLADSADRLRAAIEAMSPRVREIFLMRRVQEMSYEDIAMALDLSVPTVKSQLSRAGRVLEEYLGE